MMKLWKHILKILYEYRGAKISAPELARRVSEVGEYKGGSSQSLDYLTTDVRFAIESCRRWGYVERELCQRKFSRKIGSTPKYLYSIKPEGVRVLEHEGIS